MPPDGTAPIVVKYRLVFADDRYRFAEPRGGRLNLGVINPSSTSAQDPDLTNKPATRKLSDLITDCLKAMGLDDVDLPPEADDVDPPEDLKWFGTHAPTELAKLLAMADCVLVLQPDATYEVYLRGDGADPDIPDGRALPVATMSGSDGRGKTVIFTSFPTQIAMVLRADDDHHDFEPSNFRVVARKHDPGQDDDQAWVPIDSCGVYGTSAITTLNQHFNGSSASQAEQESAYRYLQLDPDIYGPLVSPLLRKTWADPDSDDGGEGGGTSDETLPNQVDLVIKAVLAVPDPGTTTYRNSPTPVPIPIVGTYDANVLKLGLRLVKLPDDTPSTVDLDGKCVAVDPSDLQCRIAVGQSEYDGERRLWKPGYFYSGFSGTADAMTTLGASDAEAAMSDPDAIVITVPDLVAVQYGEDGDGPYNKDALVDRCRSMAARYLQDASKPPRLLAAVGFLDFTFDGTLSEVEIDQEAVLTRFRVDSWFRPDGSYIAAEFERLRLKQEKHPHQAETQGDRQAMGSSGSSVPVQPMDHYVPPPVPGAITVNITSGSGNGAGVYEGFMYSGQLSTTDVTSLAAGGACYIINGPEVNAANDGQSPLDLNGWAFGGALLGTNAEDGKPIIGLNTVRYTSCGDGSGNGNVGE